MEAVENRTSVRRNNEIAWMFHHGGWNLTNRVPRIAVCACSSDGAIEYTDSTRVGIIDLFYAELSISTESSSYAFTTDQHCFGCAPEELV